MASGERPVAKIQGLLIHADNMYRDSEKELVELEGSVQIIYQAKYIKADKAVIYLRAKRAELFGHVEMADPKNLIKADQIFLDYESNTGIIYNGFVQSGLVKFSGDTLEKISEQEYLVSSADYTACSNCPSTWSFSGSSIRAELGGYAYIKNAVLRVSDVPIFWMPYIVVPLKSDRQSGFLTPGFEQSDTGGFTLIQPYFWAISRNTDSTLSAVNYEHRGIKGIMEYRYLLSESSFGNLNAAILEDRAFGKSTRLNSFRESNTQGDPLNRWFIRYDHFFEMEENLIARAQANLASDLQYSKDFPLETLNYGDSAMENRISFTKNTNTSHASIDTSYYMNMLQANPVAGYDDSVHRAPEIRYSSLQKNISGTHFIYSWDLNYVNFTRAGNSYDNLTDLSTAKYGTIKTIKTNCGNDKPNWSDYPTCHPVYDGTYDSNIDLIRAGQRLDFKPSLYYPLKVREGVDIVPILNYRETHYNFNVGDEQSYVRRYLRTSVSGRMILSRTYENFNEAKSTRYKHEIIPEITYTNIPWISQKNHPFFGTGPLNEAPYSSRDGINDGDLTSPYGLQFDYQDRIYDRNLINFVLTNKITQKKWIGDRMEYKQIGSLKLLQSYDGTQLDRSNNNIREPWSDLMAILDLRFDTFQSYSIFDYFPYQGVTNISSRVRLSNPLGHFGQVGLTQQYKITAGQPVDQSTRTEDFTFAGGFIAKHITLMAQIIYDANWKIAKEGKPLKSWAYIAEFKPPGDCWLIRLIQDQVTGGETNSRLSFEFTFDGKPQPTLRPDALQQFGF